MSDSKPAPIGPPWRDRYSARADLCIYHGATPLVDLIDEAMLALATHDSTDPAFLAFREGFRAAWWATHGAISPAQAVRTLLHELAGIDLAAPGTIPGPEYRERLARAYAAMMEPKPASPPHPGQPGRPLIGDPA